MAGVTRSGFSYDNELVLDPDEVMKFIDSVGAASINETKTYFGTGSKNVRRVIGHLLIADQITLTAYAGGIYISRRTGERGKTNVRKLRLQAGVPPRTRAVKSRPVAADSSTHPGYEHKKTDPNDPFEA